MPDFIYPRTVTILRPNTQLSTTGGAGQGQPSQTGGPGSYWGASQKPTSTNAGAGEQTILANVSCSIQGTTGRATGTGETPSDAPGPSRWEFFIPLGSVPKGTIKREDILVDDESNRYQVSAPYWNSLGWKVEAILLDN